MNDTPLLLAIHELNKWLDECKELERGLGERDIDDILQTEIQAVEKAIFICRKQTNHDKPTESEVQ